MTLKIGEEAFEKEEFNEAQNLSRELYDNCVGKLARVGILGTCMSLAQLYIVNYEEERTLNNPEEFGELIGGLVEILIERAHFERPN